LGGGKRLLAFIDQDMLTLVVSKAVDRELARVLRRADNGGRGKGSEEMEWSEEEVLVPYLREEERGRREGESWKEMLKRQRKEEKVRRQERNRGSGED
jgi:hypothetical protein